MIHNPKPYHHKLSYEWVMTRKYNVLLQKLLEEDEAGGEVSKPKAT